MNMYRSVILSYKTFFSTGAETFLVSLEAQMERGVYLTIAQSSIVVYDCQQFQM